MPSEVDIRAVDEVNVDERANAKRLRTWHFEQRNQAEVAIGRAEGVSHDVFDFTPLTLDVVGRKHE